MLSSWLVFTSYGMSDLGPVQLEHRSGEVFLGRDYTNSSKNYSDAVALEIDQEINIPFSQNSIYRFHKLKTKDFTLQYLLWFYFSYPYYQIYNL